MKKDCLILLIGCIYLCSGCKTESEGYDNGILDLEFATFDEDDNKKIYLKLVKMFILVLF